MKKITPEELEVFLRKHKLWLVNDPNGERAYLRGANLYGANLYGANLSGADLYGANLSGANLYGANLSGANLYGANLSGADLRGAYLSVADLRGADLYGANLYGANLSGADLYGANLYGANLSGADLSGADLRGADLYEADLRGANLSGANLYRANLSGAYLRGADLSGAENVSIPIACPEKGSFTAFKKASGYIVELLIPADAKRSSATSRKCRCDKAEVVSITNIDGSESLIESVSSSRDPDFIYEVGKIVSVDNFDENRFNECTSGIHFFITRQEAVEWYI